MNTVYGCYFTDCETETMLLFVCDTVEKTIVEIYQQKNNHLMFKIDEIRLDWDCDCDEEPQWGSVNIFTDNELQCSFVFEQIPYIK